MKLSFVAPLFLAASLAAFAQQGMPKMSTVDPGTGKAGDEITVAGENLDKALVAKVYLTDGKNDVLLALTDQTATSIKFKIPTKVNGRFALMLLTTGKDPKLIEQPVKLTVE
jgi:IPT/TIG domain-containing protein